MIDRWVNRVTAVAIGSLLICAGFTSCSRHSTPTRGQQLYASLCQSCHQADGRGVPGLYAPLAGTAVPNGEPTVMINWVMYGIRPESLPRGAYSGAMPEFNFLSDSDAAALLTHVRQSFGNQATPVAPEVVAQVRAAHVSQR